MEFKQKLKELENESVKLENQITQLKQEKSHILGEVVEAERQILLWDRKIQLEKEMQDTLDPTIGQKQIVAMKKEIHRMELQYNLYRKEQEKLIKDMERAVFKRETIQLKYMPKVEKKNAQDSSTKGKLSRQIANLKQNLKHTTENTMQLDITIDAKRQEIGNVSNEINTEKETSEDQQNNLRQRQIDMLSKQIAYQRSAFETRGAKVQGDRYAQIATGKYPCPLKTNCVH
jgi:coiled-coil domain-containing protein 40